MKNRLILLFELFKQIGGTSADLEIIMDRSFIEDWNQTVYINYNNSSRRNVKIPFLMVKTLKDLVKKYDDVFWDYNNYDNDEIWYLLITINYIEKKIIFRSQCKEETYNKFSHDFKKDDFSEIVQNYISELTNNASDIVDFEFFGRWDDGEIYNVNLNGKKNTEFFLGNDHAYWEICNAVMEKIISKYWNSEQGATGEIRLWGDDIFVRGKELLEEYQWTDLNLVVTPDNVED
jgi:hypothetical protein